MKKRKARAGKAKLQKEAAPGDVLRAAEQSIEETETEDAEKLKRHTEEQDEATETIHGGSPLSADYLPASASFSVTSLPPITGADGVSQVDTTATLGDSLVGLSYRVSHHERSTELYKAPQVPNMVEKNIVKVGADLSKGKAMYYQQKFKEMKEGQKKARKAKKFDHENKKARLSRELQCARGQDQRLREELAEKEAHYVTEQKEANKFWQEATRLKLREIRRRAAAVDLHIAMASVHTDLGVSGARVAKLEMEIKHEEEELADQDEDSD